jgi:hypothetical protein
LYLLIVSEVFRRVAAAVAAIAVVALVLFVLWINREESQNARRAEAAKTYIKTDQIELADPRATFGFAGRITGRIRNNSGHALASFALRVAIQDCSPLNQCKTVDDENPEIKARVPPGQSRDFEGYLMGSNISPRGQLTWSYQILSVSAETN